MVGARNYLSPGRSARTATHGECVPGSYGYPVADHHLWGHAWRLTASIRSSSHVRRWMVRSHPRPAFFAPTRDPFSPPASPSGCDPPGPRASRLRISAGRCRRMRVRPLGVPALRRRSRRLWRPRVRASRPALRVRCRCRRGVVHLRTAEAGHQQDAGLRSACAVATFTLPRA
jgi:hypothetical protein